MAVDEVYIPAEKEQDPGSSQLQDAVIALLPLKNVVLLPKSIIPIIVGRTPSIQAVEFSLKNNKSIFITAQKNPEIEVPSSSDLYTHGTRAIILQVMRMPNGALKVLAEGICRAQIVETIESDGFMSVSCIDVPTTGMDRPVELEALWRQLRALYISYAKLNERTPTDLVTMVKTADDMDYVTDTIAIHVSNLSLEERQTVLEANNLKDRMLQLCALLKKEVEILQTEQRIRGQVQTQVEKSQREYYLTEQMKAIQKELGREDQSTEIDQIKEKLKTLKLSPEAAEKVSKELKRLEQMPPLSSEAVVSRHYIDWLTSLPWHEMSTDTVSLTKAENILEENHAGLLKAKERILEFIAAKKFSKSMERSPIICLVGPPGVGKTSLAKSIADSMKREFVRISLGGIRDEAEIRGHRRTYIGALPGKIIQAMKKAKTINPVILLDEIEKMGADTHGDPAAALLEVLDPEQNKSFVDHFLDVEYDLSKVMFIATANISDDIPYPLYDRMEIINLSGYVDEEKLHICKRFLIPKNLKQYSLTSQQFKLSPELIKILINEYTKEAGVRQLERVIAKLMRKVIQLLLKNKTLKNVPITLEIIRQWLGGAKFKKTNLSAEKRVGLSTGLAWTEFGGDVLEIETTIIPGKGAVTLTGQLGDIMQESAQAALSYIRSRAADLGLKSSFHTSKDIHIHIPEGATPKDGPSAGIAICCAVISALVKQPLKPFVVMTGEITLQGRVLAVGGLKAKLLAAKQHDMKMVIVPHENYEDIEEIKKEVDIASLQIVYVKSMDEIINTAFEIPILNQVKPKKAARKSKAKSQHLKKTVS